FVPGLIRVKEFRIPGEQFAVYHLPRHYQDFLRNPGGPEFGDEERQEFPGLIEQWQERGNFVLEWGNDFWLDSTGEVGASLGSRRTIRCSGPGRLSGVQRPCAKQEVPSCVAGRTHQTSPALLRRP